MKEAIEYIEKRIVELIVKRRSWGSSVNYEWRELNAQIEELEKALNYLNSLNK